MEILDFMKEFDVLLLSQDPLPENDVKKITNFNYLMKMKQEKGKMLAMVHQRRKKNKNYITLKIDLELH